MMAAGVASALLSIASRKKRNHFACPERRMAALPILEVALPVLRRRALPSPPGPARYGPFLPGRST